MYVNNFVEEVTCAEHLFVIKISDELYKNCHSFNRVQHIPGFIQPPSFNYCVIANNKIIPNANDIFIIQIYHPQFPKVFKYQQLQLVLVGRIYVQNVTHEPANRYLERIWTNIIVQFCKLTQKRTQ